MSRIDNPYSKGFGQQIDHFPHCGTVGNVAYFSRWLGLFYGMIADIPMLLARRLIDKSIEFKASGARLVSIV